LIVAYAVRAGVPAEDAEDVAQSSLLAFSSEYQVGKYDRNRGRLRSWLFGIVHHEVQDWRRSRGRRGVRLPESEGDGDFFARVEAPAENEKVWDEEWDAAVLRGCLEEVRRELQPTTFGAFEAFAVRGEPAEQVAERFGLTPNAVYCAKRRILRRVRELLPLVKEVW
jgi:RNA polymerase sigma-70 factor (ECF subfamily)